MWKLIPLLIHFVTYPKYMHSIVNDSVSIKVKPIMPNKLKYECDKSSRKGVGYPISRVVGEIREKYPEADKAAKFIYDFFESFISEKTTQRETDTINNIRLSLISAVKCKKLVARCPNHLYEDLKLFEQEKKILSKQFKIGVGSPEVFCYHHGLKLATQKLKDYIRSKDFFDIGAFVGDSACILSQYTDKKVHSFEISKKTLKTLIWNVNNNQHMIKNRSVINHLGISDKSGILKFTDGGNGGTGLDVKQNAGVIEVNVTTIDEYVNAHNLEVGFIKADVEGIGFSVVRGGINTILKHQPVISIAVYHSFGEMFEMVQYLREKLPTYVFEFHNENGYIESGCELSMFAYPSHLR